jgi:hypothetical protein
MLPRVLYELLPYIYFSIGLGSGITINTAIVFIASAILMAAGILILTMRISYRRAYRRSARQAQQAADQVANQAANQADSE